MSVGRISKCSPPDCGNQTSSSQGYETERPSKRLRRKRKLLLDSDDEEENADDDEVMDNPIDQRLHSIIEHNCVTVSRIFYY